jgi:hypothetical protein
MYFVLVTENVLKRKIGTEKWGDYCHGKMEISLELDK